MIWIGIAIGIGAGIIGTLIYVVYQFGKGMNW